MQYEDNLSLILSTLRGGLYSSNKEINIRTMKVYSRLFFHFYALELLKEAWEWFISPEGVLEEIITIMQKHKDIRQLGFELLVNIGRGNLCKLFEEYLKDNWSFIVFFIPFLSKLMDKVTCAEKKEGVDKGSNELKKLIGCLISSVVAFNNEGSDKAMVVTLFSELWFELEEFIDPNHKIANRTLNALKSAVRDKNLSLQVLSIAYLFKLLEVAIMKKSQYAPTIYRTLAFILIENYQVEEIRELILDNFTTLIDNKIPIEVLIEPLSRQIQIVQDNFNVTDYKLYNKIIQSAICNDKDTVQVMDVLSKIILSEPLFSNIAKILLINMMKKKGKNNAVIGFLKKFIKVSLVLLVNTIKKKQVTALEHMMCLSIIEILQMIQRARDEELKKLLETLAVEAYLELKISAKEDYPPLKVLVSYYGNLEESEASNTQALVAFNSNNESIDESSKKSSLQFKKRSNRSCTLYNSKEITLSGISQVPKSEVKNKAEEMIEKIWKEKQYRDTQVT